MLLCNCQMDVPLTTQYTPPALATPTGQQPKGGKPNGRSKV
jgi:hypothetical protein